MDELKLVLETLATMADGAKQITPLLQRWSRGLKVQSFVKESEGHE